MELRAFLFQTIYRSEPVMVEVRKAQCLLGALFDFFMAHPGRIPDEFVRVADGDDVRAVTDFLTGMTDRYAVSLFQDLYVPRAFGR